MHQDEHPIKKRNRRKTLIIVLALAVILVGAADISLAYANHSSAPLVNKFSPSEISCEIEETVTDGVKSSVTVQNTGKAAAYIRVAVIANTVDESGSITGAADVSSCLCGDGWVKADMYYYYTQPVAPGGMTGELLGSSIDLKGIQVTVLAEAIQSEPIAAAQETWGVAPASLGSD